MMRGEVVSGKCSRDESGQPGSLGAAMVGGT